MFQLFKCSQGEKNIRVAIGEVMPDEEENPEIRKVEKSTYSSLKQNEEVQKMKLKYRKIFVKPERYEVIIDYDPEKDDFVIRCQSNDRFLKLKKGDKVIVVSKKENYFKGRKHGKVGFFPSRCVRKCSAVTKNNQHQSSEITNGPVFVRSKPKRVMRPKTKPRRNIVRNMRPNRRPMRSRPPAPPTSRYQKFRNANLSNFGKSI